MNLFKHNYILVTIAVLSIILCLLPYIFGNKLSWGQFKQTILHQVISYDNKYKTAKFNQIETEHFLIKYLTVDQGYSNMIARASEEAYESVGQMMGTKPQGKVTLIVYPDSENLANSFGWEKDEKALGVYWGGSISILSPRVWLEDKSNEEQFKQEGPMVHEFAHLLVDEMSCGNYNRWWTEGIAQYVEKNINDFEFAYPFNNKTKKYYTLKEMEKNYDKLDQSIVYWQSLKAVEYIADEFGEGNIYTILCYLKNGDSMETAVERALSIDYDIFETNYYQYLERA